MGGRGAAEGNSKPCKPFSPTQYIMLLFRCLTDLVDDGADGGGVGEVDEVDVGVYGDPEEERRVGAPPLRPLHPHH